MSETYTKLFSSITESTVWGESYPTRIVWVTLLAMADARGEVYGSVPGIARRANVTLPEAKNALLAFLSPDEHSRTKDEDGRRIEEITGGWRLINHAKYSAVRNAEERREYKRKWDQENRGKTKSDKSDTNPTNPTGAATPTPTPTPTPALKKEPTATQLSTATPPTPAPADEPDASEAPTPAVDRLAATVAGAYHDTLPRCARIEVLSPKRVKRIHAANKLARQVCGQQGWDFDVRSFWESYFAECLSDPWLRGDLPNPHNPRWRQNLHVLIQEDRFAEIMDRAISRLKSDDAP